MCILRKSRLFSSISTSDIVRFRGKFRHLQAHLLQNKQRLEICANYVKRFRENSIITRERSHTKIDDILLILIG